MSWIMTKRGSQDNIITYEHYCDTFSDLSNIPSSQVTLGSTAVVINDEDNGLGIYMANSQKEWVPISTSIGGGSGEITLDLIHICSSEEYDSSTKVPTIEDAEVNKIYLVPNNASGNNLFDEWIYADDAWEKIGEGNINIPVSDVQVNGTSIVDGSGVANVPIASANDLGVAKVNELYGVKINDSNTLVIKGASSTQVQTATDAYHPVVPAQQHKSVFYGLAKAAGDTTQSQSNNAVGTYTSEAKTAIQTMLDVPSSANLSLKADKADTVLETTLSRGRKENSIVGNGSLAFGYNVEATGSYSAAFGTGSAKSAYAYAEGHNTIASGTGSHAEGSSTTASGGMSHAEGSGTIAVGLNSHVQGAFNIKDSYNDWPEWIANTEYAVNDKVKVTTIVDNETTITGYICKTANSDAEFTVANWTKDTKMNYVEIVGNGTSNARSNAYALDWDGNGHYAGDVYVGCNSDSTGGTKLPTDVQVNGVSVVSNGVANVPVASDTTFGAVKLGAFGVTKVASGINKDKLCIECASAGFIKSATDQYRPIVSSHQHESAFYGLATAAGDTTQKNSSNAVGTYTDEAKAAIQSMIGVGITDEVVSGTTPTITGVSNHRYHCGEVASISFTPSGAGICDVVFTSGTTPAVLTIPNTVKLPEWFDATSLEPSTIYEISVADGVYGVVTTWQA